MQIYLLFYRIIRHIWFYRFTTMLQCYNATMLQCYNTTILQYYSPRRVGMNMTTKMRWRSFIVFQWRYNRCRCKLFWWVKWAKTYHARAFLYRFGVSFSSDKRVFGGEKATFLATTKTEKRGDATFFRGGSCREGFTKIRADVRVGRGFLCLGRPFLHVEKSVAL